MNFFENNEITGHLEICKVYKDGSREVVFDDHNIITSGMGVTLAGFLGTVDTSPVSAFQINHWQLGEGASSAALVSSLPVSGRCDVLSAFDASAYGTASKTSFQIVSGLYMTSGGSTASKSFVRADQSRTVTRVATNSIQWRLLVDENACNGKTISEAALFSNDPTTAATDVRFMVAYRAFTGIPKTSGYALDFRWRINF